MQYEVNIPAEYIDALAIDWRRKTLENVRALIKLKAPNLKEGINYKMLSYSDHKGIPFHLNAQKSYVSLYVGDIKKIDLDGTLLEGVDTGKGCIRFTKSIDVANTQIDEFIERAIHLWDKGVNIGC